MKTNWGIRTVLGALCTGLLFTSCSGPFAKTAAETEETETDTTAATETETMPVTEEDSADAVTEPAEEPTWQEELDSALKEGVLTSSVPAYCTATDIKGIYDMGLSLETPEGAGVDTEVLDGFLYVGISSAERTDDGFPAELTVEVYDIESGKSCGSVSTESPWAWGCIDGGGVWYADNSLHMTLTDSTLQPVFTVELVEYAEQGYTGSSFSLLSFTQDGKYWYYMPAGSSDLHVGCVADGLEKTVDLSAYTLDYPWTLEGEGMITLLSWGNGIITVNPDDGSASMSYENGNASDCRNGIFLTQSESEFLLSDCYGNSKIISRGAVGDLYSFSAVNLCGDLLFCLGWDDGVEWAAYYDLEKAEIIGMIPYDDSDMVLSRSDGIYTVLADSRTAENGSLITDICLVNARELAEDQIYGLNETCDVLYVEKGELASLCNGIAAEIYDMTGAEVFYGSQGNDFTGTCYVGEAVLDNFVNYLALKELKETLALYPEGMLQEIEDKSAELRFYLCGTLWPAGAENMVAKADALTYDGTDGAISVVCDIIGSSVKATVPHELSHVLDRAINSWFYEYNELSFDDDWIALNPDSSFLMSYVGYEEETLYVMGYEDEADSTWFTIPYARTFPTEDRAVLMQTLFDANDDEGIAQEFTEYPNLLEKAEYYCNLIRIVFSSCDTVEPTYWEQVLTALGYVPDVLEKTETETLTTVAAVG